MDDDALVLENGMKAKRMRTGFATTPCSFDITTSTPPV
jgi:hypothetical protein